jgi:hypothetical protein
MTRIFLALDETQFKDLEQPAHEAKSWPPFPWPRTLFLACDPTLIDVIAQAWGDDDDEDKPTPKPKKSAEELARAVVDFEREMARASLDLCVAFYSIPWIYDGSKLY